MGVGFGEGPLAELGHRRLADDDGSGGAQAAYGLGIGGHGGAVGRAAEGGDLPGYVQLVLDGDGHAVEGALRVSRVPGVGLGEGLFREDDAEGSEGGVDPGDAAQRGLDEGARGDLAGAHQLGLPLDTLEYQLRIVPVMFPAPCAVPVHGHPFRLPVGNSGQGSRSAACASSAPGPPAAGMEGSRAARAALSRHCPGSGARTSQDPGSAPRPTIPRTGEQTCSSEFRRRRRRPAKATAPSRNMCSRIAPETAVTASIQRRS